MDSTPAQYGLDAQREVNELLVGAGLDSRNHLKGPYDITCAGLRIEVKASRWSKLMEGWSINLHRRGVLDESQVDAYIFRLDDKGESVYLFLRAPLRKLTFPISRRALSRPYLRKAARDFDSFIGRPTQPHPAPCAVVMQPVPELGEFMVIDPQKIKDARERQFMTLHEVASKVGVSVVAVWRWEQGKAEPRLRHRRPLAKALRVSFQQLCSNGDEQ